MSSLPDPKFTNNELLPSYEDSVTSSNAQLSDHKSGPAARSFQQRLADSRADMVNQVLEGDIEPWLLGHGRDGVAKRTLILLPSDCLSDQQFMANNIIAPVVSKATRLIGLQGPGNEVSFWQQQGVVDLLDEILKRRIVGESSRGSVSTGLISASPGELGKSHAKKAFDPTGSTGNWNLGWKPEGDEAGKKLQPGQAHISARIRDTSFRYETELGLLTTETVKCVWIELEVSV